MVKIHDIRPPESHKNYLTVKQAAKLLGIHPLTLRNWDKTGKLKAIRHPINNYRLYPKEQIEAILKQISSQKNKPTD